MTPLERLEQHLKAQQPHTVIYWQEWKFHYAAIKTSNRWYTTATTENPYVEHEMDDHELAVHLMMAASIRSIRISNALRWPHYDL